MRAGRWTRDVALGFALCVAGWTGGCSGGGSGGNAASGGAGIDASGGASSGGSAGAAGAAAQGGTAGDSGASGAAGTAGAGGLDAGTGGAGGVDAGSGGAGGKVDGGGHAGTEGSAGFDSGVDASGGAAGQAGSDGGVDAAGGAAGQAGSDGGVDAAVCAPDAYACSGDELRRCASDGSGYSTVQKCQAGHCSAATGTCLECLDASECAPGGECKQATCVANTCSTAPIANGTPCANGQCNGQGVCGCVPGSKRCTANVPESCDTNGAWQSASACAGPTPNCYDGACEPATPASCASLAESCGPGSSSYCCASRAVPAGSFSRSYDAVSPYTDASYAATLSDFRLDVYEVSVARFRAFVDAGGGTQAKPPAAGAGANPAISGSGWDASWDGDLVADTTSLRAALHCSSSYETWTDAAGANEARPVNCVTWYEAFAFCAWDGARLPTEAEWNYAAAGGSEQRVYPWSAPSASTSIDPSQASYWVDGTQQCMGDGTPGCSLSDLVQVGSKSAGAGRWGQLDMAGNVWEWTLDVYKNPYAENPCIDCAELSSGTNRVIRGGAFFANAASALVPTRSPAAANGRYYSVGVRCAR